MAVKVCEMEIRNAIASEIPALMALEQSQKMSAHWAEGRYLELFSTPNSILLIAADPDLCGFVAGSVVLDECELQNIVVSANRTRLGIASALMRTFTGEAGKKGARRVMLEVRESNLAARGLYAKLGFHEAGLRRAYYQDPPEDAILLERET